VVFPEAPPPGQMRVADAADAEVAAEFAHGFYEVARDHLGDVEAIVRTAIDEQRLFLWETEAPVSMAAWVRDTPNSKAVALVFTPENERRKGYASSLVAQVCHRALISGKRHCVLFADIANPTSNHIYQAIGFKPVCDNVHLVFEPLPL
jgi:predicted GNAT family acetyltransferase